MSICALRHVGRPAVCAIMLLAGSLLAVCRDDRSTSVAMAARPTATPLPRNGSSMMPTWMTPPPLSTFPIGRGETLYYYRCMACHGDRGQGLTVEWRAQWPEEHQDCSIPQCHGKRHPPEGFEFPRNFAPAIMGPGALARFETAQDLYAFISTRMPYQAPGILSQEDYWALTAFILYRQGVLTDNIPLGPATAGQVRLHSSLTQAKSEGESGAWLPLAVPAVLAFGGMAMGLGAVRLWRVRWHARSHRS